MRRNVLALMSRLPWPLDDGGRVGLYQIAWSLTRRFDVTMLALVPPGTENEALPQELKIEHLRIVRVPHRPPPTIAATLAGALGRWPYTLARYRSGAMEKAIRAAMQERVPDLAYLSSLHMATYVDVLGRVPAVLREQNVEFVWMQRFARSLKNPVTKLYAGLQAGRLRRVEADLCSRMSLVLAIHEQEAERLRSICPSARVEVVPVGIDPARFPPPSRRKPPIALITGSFGWKPNWDGLRRFLDQGWPRLLELVPEVKLRVVGKDLPPRPATLAGRDSVEWAGHVPSIEPEFASASVLIVPLWVGAGARIKIVEAALARLPVISSALGVEGLGLTNPINVRIAESAEALADAAAGVLRDAGGAEAMATAAFEHAAREFSLECVAQRTVDLCSAAMSGATDQSAAQASAPRVNA